MRGLKAIGISPVLAVGVFGVLAGLALIVLGLIYGPARPGSARLVGGFLIALSSILIFPRLKPHATSPPPPGDSRLPPAQEAVLDVKAVEREKVVAIGKA